MLYGNNELLNLCSVFRDSVLGIHRVLYDPKQQEANHKTTISTESHRVQQNATTL